VNIIKQGVIYQRMNGGGYGGEGSSGSDWVVRVELSEGKICELRPAWYL